MKNIVVNDEYRQVDLKPTAFFDEYLALLHQDMLTLVGQNTLKQIDCPACKSAGSQASFERFGLQYHTCVNCASLFVNPRPSDTQLSRFFKESKAKVFWRNQLFEASQQQRKNKIIKPRVEWVIDSTAEYLPLAKHWVDLHTSQQRYIEALSQSAFPLKTVIFPYGNFMIPTGVNLVNKPWWEINDDINADVITAFEVMDHACDVDALFMSLKKMLNNGGLCFLTTILGSGFDIKELGNHAPNVFPPDRLNALSVKGLRELIERHGFECLEFSTPGVLDLDIVAQALQRNPSIAVSEFIKSLALNADEDTKRSFSEFLQRNLLSSYGRILIRKA